MTHHSASWLLLLQLLALLQPSTSFNVNRTDRDCTLQATTNLYNAYYSVIDPSDLSRYRDLQMQTTSDDTLQTNFYNISTQYDQFRARTRCARPSLYANDTAKAVQGYLAQCMCQGMRIWLIQPTLAAYRCDLHYADTSDLNQLLKTKTQRFNRYVRVQLAIQGDRSLLALYDSLVSTCVDGYLDGIEGLPSTLPIVPSSPRPRSSTPQPTPNSTSWWTPTPSSTPRSTPTNTYSSGGSGSSYRHLRTGSDDSSTSSGSNSDGGGSIVDDGSTTYTEVAHASITSTLTPTSGSQAASPTSTTSTTTVTKSSNGGNRILLSDEAGVVGELTYRQALRQEK